MKKVILVDLDGPLANFEGRFLEIWKERYSTAFFVSFENRTQFRIVEQYPKELKANIESILIEENFFFSFLPVKPGIEAVKEIISLGHTVFICSSGIYRNKQCLTEKKLWIEKYLGIDLAKSAIFTYDKTIVRGDYLIDDNPNIDKGILTPLWEHIIYDQPFNKDSNKLRIKEDWSNWKEMIQG